MEREYLSSMKAQEGEVQMQYNTEFLDKKYRSKYLQLHVKSDNVLYIKFIII